MWTKLLGYYEKYKEAIRYIIVGGCTTLVSLATYYLCVFTFLNPNVPVQLQAANIISWVCSVTFAFFANRRIVFNSRNKNILGEAVKFYGARVATLLMDMLLMAALVSLLHINDKIAKILVQAVLAVLNYLFSKYIVFKKQKDDVVS